MYQLEISEDVQQTTAATPSPFGNTDANEPRAQFSSKTEWGQEGSNPQYPRRGSFRASDSDKEKLRNDKYVRLEGILPREFNGDQSKTHQFLIQFKCFMRMNEGAHIARNLMSKASYFLSLLSGLKVVRWVEWQHNWLDKIEVDPHGYPLPYGLYLWQVLEAEFEKAFIDYMAREKAHDNLWKLKMHGGNIDQYIVDFQFLASWAEINVNDPAAIRLFQLGLPIPLAEACIDLKKPANFEQWTLAAQAQQHGWIQKKWLQAQKEGNMPNQNQGNQITSQGNNNQRGQFFWKWNNGGNTCPSHAQLPPQDPNAIDTSATIWKATTDAEKQKHRQEGRCFECSKWGDIACMCPNKKTCARASNLNPSSSNSSSIGSATTSDVASVMSDDTTTTTSSADIAVHVLRFLDEERTEFTRVMKEGGEEMGFLNAWM